MILARRMMEFEQISKKWWRQLITWWGQLPIRSLHPVRWMTTRITWWRMVALCYRGHLTSTHPQHIHPTCSSYIFLLITQPTTPSSNSITHIFSIKLPILLASSVSSFPTSGSHFITHFRTTSPYQHPFHIFLILSRPPTTPHPQYTPHPTIPPSTSLPILFHSTNELIGKLKQNTTRGSLIYFAGWLPNTARNSYLVLSCRWRGADVMLTWCWCGTPGGAPVVPGEQIPRLAYSGDAEMFRKEDTDTIVGEARGDGMCVWWSASREGVEEWGRAVDGSIGN